MRLSLVMLWMILALLLFLISKSANLKEGKAKGFIVGMIVPFSLATLVLLGFIIN